MKTPLIIEGFCTNDSVQLCASEVIIMEPERLHKFKGKRQNFASTIHKKCKIRLIKKGNCVYRK